MAGYTKAQCRAIAKALTAAKPYLWDGKGEEPYRGEKSAYICSAIGFAYPLNQMTNEGFDLAGEVVMNRLEGRLYFNGWLEMKGIHRKDITPPRLQTHRHAWVDLLIAEFTARGKKSTTT